MKKFCTVLVLVFLVTTAFITTSCDKKKDDDVIRIGAILPLTGELSYLGIEEKNTLELLQSNINQDKMKIEFVFQDSKGNAKDGLTAYTYLNNKNIKYYITSLTVVARAIAPKCLEDNNIQFSLSIDPTLAREYENVISIYYNIGDEMNKIANHFSRIGAKRIGGLYINTSESRYAIENILKEELEKRNIELIHTESYDFSTKSFKDQLLKLGESNVEYIHTIDFGYLYPVILKEAYNYNLLSKIVGGLGIMTAPQMSKELTSNLIFVTASFEINPNDDYSRFQEQYNSLYGRNSTFDGVYCYDTGKFLIDILLSGKNITFENFTNKKFSGISGDIIIDSFGVSHVELKLANFNDKGDVVEFAK